MKFWKTFKNFGTLDRNGNNNNNNSCNGKRRSSAPAPQTHRISLTPSISRRKKKISFGQSFDEDPIYEDFQPSPSPSVLGSHEIDFGTTFVELIKRPRTKLGVVVTGSVVDLGSDPRISELVPGSWAQRSDVLCLGDLVVSINGVSTDTMSQKDINKALETSDRVQLEVRYALPQQVPSRNRFSSKVIQVTLRKENGSFGMVIRGGHNDVARKTRPFTVIHITSHGPAFREGTIRVNDRIRAVNGHQLHNMKLPELQSLLYQQDRETVFTIEYDVAKHERIDHGNVLVEIRRDINDIIGIGLNKCSDSGHVFVESIKQASLADRCGAVSVGDILLAVNGRNVARLSKDETSDLIRGDPDIPHVVQLEILPGLFSSRLSTSSLGSPFRSSMPSPCFSSLRHHRSRSGQRCQRYNSLTEIDRPLSSTSTSTRQSPRPPALPSNAKERKKFVTFTVDLQRDGGPLGLTLATEEAADKVGPIFISALMHEGLAERTRTIQVNDQLVEVNGVDVSDKCLNDVIPMLQGCSNDIIKLKLARFIHIPERDFSVPALTRKSSMIDHNNTYGNFRKPPLPLPSPSTKGSSVSSANPSRASSRRDSASSTITLTTNRDHSPTPNNTVSLLPMSALSNPNISRPIPMEVHKVTLFKDPVYEDFGFSISDGLYEKGVFLNRIRKGGPADLCGLLKPLDRILQINDTRTTDFDCCLAVPLIAAAGEKIELLVARTTRVYMLRDSVDEFGDVFTNGFFEEDDKTLTRRKLQRGGSLNRVSRTSSADGRLSGSLTNHVVPWTLSGFDDGDNAVL